MRTAVLTYNTSHYILLFRRNLIRTLQLEGYRVVAVAPRDEHSTKFSELGVDYVPIKMNNKGVNPIGDLLLVVQLFFAYRRLHPEVALHFTIKPNIYGSMAARMLGIPVINNVTGLGTAFLREGLLRSITEHLYRLAFKSASTVFFQNKDDEGLFLARRMVANVQAALLPGSGVDIERFAPRARSSTGQRFRFLLVGRLIRDKGVLEFIDAVKILQAEGREFSAALLGQIGSVNRGAIPESEVRAWVSAGLVEYMGEREDVRESLASADCVVLPSYREGTSKTLLEAASMARPLIATDVPGCNNVVKEGVNGYLCRPGDARDLARAMRQIMDRTAAERDEMGRQGRQLMVSQFSEAIVLEKYTQAIRRVQTREQTRWS